MQRLQELDLEISQTRQSVRDVLKELDRLGPEEAAAYTKVQETKDKLSEFDKANEATMLKLRQVLTQTGGVDSLLASYRTQLDQLLQEKKKAEDRRADVKSQINGHRRELQKLYLSAENVFVPTFTDLAHHFLGMPLEIKMSTSEFSGVNLIIEVRGTTRRQAHQLSESQKFFLDIALRMALTQFVSDSDSRGTLFIDTPEGSLDIAYEKRAGEMLSKFVDAGHGVVMTANLNSSQLLRGILNRK